MRTPVRRVKPKSSAACGQVAQGTVANVVDPLYTLVAKFPKRYLPK